MKKTREQVQEEALEALSNGVSGTLAISVGVGKTRIALNHYLKHLKDLPVLVVIPRLSIKNSWQEEMNKIKFGYEGKVHFVTYISLNKLDPAKFSGVYLDEVHNIKYKHSAFLDEFKGVVIGLTGTPPKYEKGEKSQMISKYCPIRYSFTVDNAVNNEILNDYKIYLHFVQLDGKNNIYKKKKAGGGWYTSEIRDYQYVIGRLMRKNDLQNNIIAMRALMSYKSKTNYVKKMLKVFKDRKNKTLVFANTIKQAEEICDHSYHSKNTASKDNLEKFSKSEIMQMSCVNQLSEGVTIPDLEQCIIMHSYSNERNTTQRIGRILRLSKDKVASCHILCYEGTIDETWVRNALRNFEASKVQEIRWNF